MEIVLYIIAMTFALVAIFILLVFLLGDIRNSNQYRRATRVQGYICERRGIEKVAFYGRNQYRNYGKYLVRYQSPYGMQTQELLIRNRKLKSGDIVEVRYTINENGAQLVNNVSSMRLLEIMVSLLIAVLMMIWICVVVTYAEHGEI